MTTAGLSFFIFKLVDFPNFKSISKTFQNISKLADDSSTRKRYFSKNVPKPCN